MSDRQNIKKKKNKERTLVGITDVPIVKQTEVNKKFDPLNRLTKVKF